jgi:hypothetical protein
LRRVGPAGFEFEPTEQQKAQGKAILAPGELKELPGLSRTPAIAHVERLLHDSLRNANIKPDDREDLLIRLLAESRLVLLFEQTYAIIFGSQIAGLKLLNQYSKVSEEEVRTYFERVKETHPEIYGNYGYDSWLGFLISRDLVRRSNHMIEITDIGRDFLLYLTMRGLPESKPF